MDKIFHLEYFPFSYHAKVSAHFFLILALFLLPLSSSGKSISLLLALLSILLVREWHSNIIWLIRRPFAIFAGTLLFLTIIGCLYGPASLAQKTFVVEKYSKLLYFPILIAGFSDEKTRAFGLWAFMLAMFFTSSLSILKYLGALPFIDFDPDHVFRNHIMAGFMAAFACYIALVFSKVPVYRKYRPLLWSMVLVYSFHILLVNQSRTGYVAYFFLILLFFCLEKKMRKGFLFLSMFGFFSLLLCYSLNDSVAYFLDHTFSKLMHFYLVPSDTSFGLRLQFHQFAELIFSKNPWFGGGTGSFTANFDIFRPVPAWVWQNGVNAPPHVLLDPHGMYWFVAAEFGCLGLIGLLGFFYGIYSELSYLHETKAIALGLLLFFLLGNLTDSLLFYSGSGYFFLLLMALCLGERLKPIANREEI